MLILMHLLMLGSEALVDADSDGLCFVILMHLLMPIQEADVLADSEALVLILKGACAC